MRRCSQTFPRQANDTSFHMVITNKRHLCSNPNHVNMSKTLHKISKNACYPKRHRTPTQTPAEAGKPSKARKDVRARAPSPCSPRQAKNRAARGRNPRPEQQARKEGDREGENTTRHGTATKNTRHGSPQKKKKEKKEHTAWQERKLTHADAARTSLALGSPGAMYRFPWLLMVGLALPPMAYISHDV